MLRLIQIWGSPSDHGLFQAATVANICFGHGKYETSDGPVECGLESWQQPQLGETAKDPWKSLAVPA